MIRGGSALTLLVPGLAGPDAPGSGDPVEAARLLMSDLAQAALARLVGRAHARGSSLRERTLDGLLFELLGVARPAAGDWPAAALSRLAAGASLDDGVWMHADPVHLRPDMGKLVLFAPHALDLTLDEARAITGWINEHEHAPGPALEATAAACWHVRLDAVPGMRTLSPAAAHGGDVRAGLPRGPDAAAWHARMNTIQMLLHACPVNAVREAAGRPAVNSVWFWGAGRLPAPPACPWRSLWGEEPLLAGIARWCAVAVHPSPPSPEGWLAAPPQGECVLVLDSLLAPARDADVVGWRAALAELDGRWLAPLADAVRRGRIAQLQVHAGAGCGFRVTSRDLRRWWRRGVSAGDALVMLRRPMVEGAR